MENNFFVCEYENRLHGCSLRENHIKQNKDVKLYNGFLYPYCPHIFIIIIIIIIN